MALSATFTWNCSFCTKVAFEEYIRQWPTCHFKRPFGTCDNIRNVSRRCQKENPERTGFAHFFEHLLFEGTEHQAWRMV
jgi:hypothetical protein